MESLSSFEFSFLFNECSRIPPSQILSLRSVRNPFSWSIRSRWLKRAQRIFLISWCESDNFIFFVRLFVHLAQCNAFPPKQSFENRSFLISFSLRSSHRFRMHILGGQQNGGNFQNPARSDGPSDDYQSRPGHRGRHCGWLGGWWAYWAVCVVIFYGLPSIGDNFCPTAARLDSGTT